MSSSKRAVVLVSGGLDSATVLAMAKAEGYQCHPLTFDYGQRHQAEMNASFAVCRHLDVPVPRIVRVDLGVFGGSALTDAAIAVPEAPTTGIPVTYVPARNTVFLSLGLAFRTSANASPSERKTVLRAGT